MSLPAPNKNGVTDRRGSSAKRSSDVSLTKWPVVTRSVYQAIHRQAPEGMNQRVRLLCLARLRIGQALMTCDNTILSLGPNKEMDAEARALYARLRAQRVRLEKCLTEWPLEIQ